MTEDQKGKLQFPHNHPVSLKDKIERIVSTQARSRGEDLGRALVAAVHVIEATECKCKLMEKYGLGEQCLRCLGLVIVDEKLGVEV